MTHTSILNFSNRDVFRFILNVLMLAGSVFVILIPAIQNGYPLLYSDSASYIYSGHAGIVPVDRPIVYGFIVRHVSMSFSLWIVVFMQAVIFTFLTWLSFKVLNRSERAYVYTLITSVLIGLFTGASNYISQIMPDIFSAYMIWSLSLIFVSRSLSIRWLLWVLALTSALAHYSNILTISALVIISIVIFLFFQRKERIDRTITIQLIGLLLLPWLLLPIINYSYQKEFFFNKSSNIFFTGRLIESGLLKKYLSEYPEATKYDLYVYRDQLPDKIWQFVWNEDSPLYAGGCLEDGWVNCWLDKSDEYGGMIRSALLKPPILGQFVWISIIDWMKQLTVFDIGHLSKQGDDSPFKDIIPRYFDDSPMFERSNQFKEDLFFIKESTVQSYFVLLSVLLMLIIIWKSDKRYISREHVAMTLAIVIGLLVNALVCSMFSGVLNRYQGRIIWLIPMLAIFIASRYWDQRMGSLPGALKNK